MGLRTTITMMSKDTIEFNIIVSPRLVLNPSALLLLKILADGGSTPVMSYDK